MTKADFLAGKPFKFGHHEYKYSNEDKDYPTIRVTFKGKFVKWGHEVWVNKVVTKEVVS